MRLIDADKLLKLINEQKEKETGAYTKGLNAGLNIVKSIVNDEVQMPTAYDADKVVEQLETEKEKAKEKIEQGRGLLIKEPFTPYIKAIEIVKAGGIDE